MEIKIALEQDNRNDCTLTNNYITFNIKPRLTVITVNSPFRQIAVKTEDLKKILSII